MLALVYPNYTYENTEAQRDTGMLTMTGSYIIASLALLLNL